jgi:hypothetical protein
MILTISTGTVFLIEPTTGMISIPIRRAFVVCIGGWSGMGESGMIAVIPSAFSFTMRISGVFSFTTVHTTLPRPVPNTIPIRVPLTMPE